MAPCDLSAAAHAVANLTDFCAVFVRCDVRPWTLPSGCAHVAFPPSAVKAAYGTFREVYAALGVPGSDGHLPDEAAKCTKCSQMETQTAADHRSPPAVRPPPAQKATLPLHELLPWATLSRTPGCGRRIDLVIRRHTWQHTAPPLLAPLGRLLMHAPPALCVRVHVYEWPHDTNLSSASTSANTAASPRLPRGWQARWARSAELPPFEERDELFSVRRHLLSPHAGDLPSVLALHKHTQRLLPRDEAATATVLLSSPRALLPDNIDPWCHARALFSHEFGPPAIGLEDGSVVLRYSAAALKAATRRLTAEVLRTRKPLRTACPRVPSNRALREAQSRQALRRAVAMLLVRLARLPVGKGLEQTGAAHKTVSRNRDFLHRPTTFGASLGRTRPPIGAVPLSCLEPDFMHFNRELLPSAATAALDACDRIRIEEASALTQALLSQLAASQSGAPAAKRGRGTWQRSCAPKRLVAARLHPSGFFSVVHGLIKPLMYSLREGRILLTPRVLEFTSPKQTVNAGPPCKARDLSCFFQSLTPLCDQAEHSAGIEQLAAAGHKRAAKGRARVAEEKPPPWPALKNTKPMMVRGMIITQESRSKGLTPLPYRERGWFWWASQLLSYIMRPNESLSARVSRALKETGLGEALDSRRFVIGIHVRHGDACNQDEIIRARRSCTPLIEYIAAARQVVRQQQDREAQENISSRSVLPVIYLATDSLQIWREADRYRSEFDLVRLGEKEIMHHNHKFAPILWDKRVWQRHYWGQNDWTQQQAFDATLEMLLLARADAFVGKFSSNLFRAAYSLRAAHCDCAPVFISLDAPWCFDYGLHEGRNWEFPLLNVTAGRNFSDALFQC